MLQYKMTLYHLNLKILLWGYLVVGVLPALLKKVPESFKKKLTWSLFILCMGQWLRRMPAFGKKSLAWVYEKDEDNKYSCKPEQQSGSLQIICY